MKKALFFLLTVFSLHLFAQQPSPVQLPLPGPGEWHIPLSLYAKVKQLPPQQMIGILVEGNPLEVAEAAKKHNGFLSYNSGTICSVRIPAGELVGFSYEPGIVRIGNAPVNMQTLNDTMKVNVRADMVHNGAFPLTQPYKGDNVILGLIDSGIDFNHPDFKDSTGRTRILYIWDQRDTSGTGPNPWLYGTLWDSAQINAGQCTHNDLQYYGHGTHTSGIAAGNGRSTNARDYSGVAPNADIIMVALDFYGVYSPVAVADAAAFIYNTAQAMGRPCVINASVGDYYGSHDGQDLQALMIDSMLNYPSRSFVCASGNAGDEKIHLSYPVSSTDTNFTWYSTAGGNIYIQLWADTTNFNSAQMAIGCTQDGSWIEKGRTPFTTIQPNLGIYSSDTIRNTSGQRIAIVDRYGSIQGSAYSMEYLVVPDSATGYNYSLQLTGSGLFHCWSFDFYSNALPSASAYPKIAYYKSPDTTYTVCSSFQCSDRTITVGNYINRETWYDVNNNFQHDTTVTAGAIMWNSSVGPTRDGRIKPDIAAPGANSISCGVISTLPAIIAGAPYAVGIGGYHVVDGGTSAASPVVAGCAALWMQQFPSASWWDVKTAVTSCCIRDTFTGNNLPDVTWGYGKVDAFGMMTNCALTVGENSTGEQNFLQIYPNPTIGAQSVIIALQPSTEMQTLQIFNTLGEVVWTQNVTGGTTQVNVDVSNFAEGYYSVVLSGTKEVLTGKMIVD